MKIEHFERLKGQSIYREGVTFIKKLLALGVPIEYLDVNDWHSNINPSVYVHNKNNRFRAKKYKRFSIYDVSNAKKFYDKDKTIRSQCQLVE